MPGKHIKTLEEARVVINRLQSNLHDKTKRAAYYKDLSECQDMEVRKALGRIIKMCEYSKVPLCQRVSEVAGTALGDCPGGNNVTGSADNVTKQSLSQAEMADKTYSEVVKFKKRNPKASWITVFRFVPNQYKTHKSLSTAMLDISKRKNNEKQKKKV